MTIEDTLLIQKLKQGDEDAYDSIFREYYQDLLLFSSRFLWDMEAAEDIVQDIFIKLYEAGESLAITNSIRAYLFRSVRNRCLNYLRDRKVRDSHHQCFIEATIWTDSLPVFDDVDFYSDPGTLDLLKDVIKRLPQKSQEIVLMRLEKEYKFTEIAEKLNITTNSAKVQMHRAVSFMREEFAKHETDRSVDEFIK